MKCYEVREDQYIFHGEQQVKVKLIVLIQLNIIRIYNMFTICDSFYSHVVRGLQHCQTTFVVAYK